MEIWELTAREAIRDLVARYNSCGDRGRFDELLELFAPDAVMDVDGTVYEGRDAIRTIFAGAAEEISAFATEQSAPLVVRHSTSTLVIDVDSPTSARARCYYHVVMHHGLDHWGRYADAFAVVDGTWRFVHRRETLEGMTAGGWAARHAR